MVLPAASVEARIEAIGARWRATGGRGPWQAALAVAIVAIVLRVVAFVLMQNDPVGHISGVLVMGVPFSDAEGWDTQGESIMSGHGLVGGWSARRPFYAIVLGALYTWTGPSPFAVIVMQVLAGGLTAALVCRIGQRAVHGAAGVVAGLAFAFDPISIEHSYLVLTETIGTFLFVLSLHQLVVALQEDRGPASFWAGVTFALSNLTRTLTLLAFPLLTVAMLLLGRRRTGSWRRSLLLTALFCLGFGLPLGSWIGRQKVVHDLTTISDNTASGLYAAASRKHRTWSAEVDREAEVAGIQNEIKPRYDWFMARFAEEVAADPGFYAWNALRSGVDALHGLAAMPRSTRLLLLVLWCAAWLARRPQLPRDLRTSRRWTFVLVLGVAALLMVPRMGLLALAGLGFVVTAVQGPGHLVSLLLAGLVGTLAAVALFALGSDHRLLLMVSWMLPLGMAVAVTWIVRFGANLLAPVAGRTAPMFAPAWQPFAPRLQRPLILFATGMVVLNLLFVGYRNYVAPVPPLPPLPLLAAETARQALTRVEQLRPGTVDAVEMAEVERWYSPMESPAAEEANHGRTVIVHARLLRHRYPILGSGGGVSHWSRMFVPRAYDRTCTYASTLLPGGGGGPACLVLTAPLPEASDRDLLLLGRANVDRTSVYERVYLEVLAWAPLGPNGADLAQLRVTSVAAHEQLVRSLRH